MKVLLSLALAILAQERPDPEVLAAKGRAFLKRLESETAQWSVLQETGEGGRDLRVDVVSSPRKERYIFSMEIDQKTHEFFRIITGDETWHVHESRKWKRIYRPFEAPLTFPTGVFFLLRSQIQAIVDGSALRDLKYEGVVDGVATYRISFSETMEKQLRGVLAQLETVRKRIPKEKHKPELARKVSQIKDILEKGLPLRVDTQSGMIVQFGAVGRRTKFKNFQWLSRPPQNAFSVEGLRWKDHTLDMTRDGTRDLVMLGHAPIWRPGRPIVDSDVCILNVKSGELRRVPFEGRMAMPGCFLKDRTRVVIIGFTEDGGLRPFEVSLKTGQSRPLGGPLLEMGYTFMPSLSADGQKIVALHVMPGKHLLKKSLVVIDVKSGKARTIGKPIDASHPDWLPNGRGFILVRITTGDWEESKPKMICHMDLDGKVTPLFEGDDVEVLPGGRLLFSRKGSWYTASWDGKNIRRLGNGLSKVRWCTASPDGKRLLAVKRLNGGFSVETLDGAGRTATPVTHGAGLWLYPTWK